MNISEVTKDIFRLSVNLDRILFEGIWPVPNGVSLNSYIIKGEKTAIVDGVCDWDGVPETLFALLDKLNVKLDSIDYVIINHMEPDHTGWLENFKKIKPDFKIITGKKTPPLLKAYLGITENIQVVKDGDTLDLGNGKILEFMEIPNVHWPETIATFEKSSGTLLPCDAFGSFGTVNEKGYDDELTAQELAFFEKEALRYYSNIVSAFSPAVKKAIEKASSLPIKIIAPGHGIVWRKNPEIIIKDYLRYASYQKNPDSKEITLIWGSMYGNTEKAVKPAIEAMEKEGVRVNVHKVPEDSWGDILTSVWGSSGVVLAMPTYEYKMYPPMAAVLEEIGRKKAHNRKAFRFGSYGWSGGAQKELDEILEKYKMNWHFLGSVEFNGRPEKEDIDAVVSGCRALANAVLDSAADSK